MIYVIDVRKLIKYCAPDWEKFATINSNEYLLLSGKSVKKESCNQEVDQVLLVRLSDSLHIYFIDCSESYKKYTYYKGIKWN